jgi:hypothetical protein
MNFEETKGLSTEDFRTHLKTLLLDELFDLALEGIDVMIKDIDTFFDKVEENFEKRLTVDEASKQELDKLLTKLTK